jgi:L-arabinose isomerase
MKLRKPKLGLLGLITEGYEDVFPGIIKRQENYAMELVQTLSPVADMVFAGPGLNRVRIEEIMEQYNREQLDGVLIVLLAYSQGAYLTRALERNRLPLALAVVQPDQEVLDDWEELDLTVNQGIHGAQDNANVIMRGGYACEFFAGNRHEPAFVEFAADFGKACYAAARLKNTRTAVFSRMRGMGDVLTDELAFFRKLGPETCHDTIGSVYSHMTKVSDTDIKHQIESDHERFDVDPKLSYEAHAEAVREYFGFKRYLEDNGFGAFTAHFDQFAADGRFRQLPLYAASNLLAEGYGYAAEGDAVCASMVYAAHAIGNNDGNFTEMYTMDFKKRAIIFCHAGEGNWATARNDIRPKLIDRYLGEGGLENPPTFIFTPQPGPATLTSLVSLEGGRFRLLLAKGGILRESGMKRCEMPYFFWRPESGVETCVQNWLANAGTHHEVINLGDVSRRWSMLAKMLRIEYVEA